MIYKHPVSATFTASYFIIDLFTLPHKILTHHFSLLPLQKDKMILMIVKQTVPLHFGEFIRKGAAVHSQVIRHLLPVKWNFNLFFPLLYRFRRKVG